MVYGLEISGRKQTDYIYEMYKDLSSRSVYSLFMNTLVISQTLFVISGKWLVYWDDFENIDVNIMLTVPDLDNEMP
jgi:hypothetical protein